MRYTTFFLALFAVCFAVQLNAELDDTEIQVYFQLPKAKSKITANEKEMIVNGLKGAVQFMKFLNEKKFFSMLTKISSVAGPIFMVATAILEIVFLFLDIESPEMALMKKEFKNINNRMDKWEVEFSEIKRKIDWSAVQVHFSDIENTIITLSKMLEQLPNAPQEMREELAQKFLNRYKFSYGASGDVLFNAMINIDQIYSANLFKAAQKYYEFHRGMIQAFMMSNMVLLTKAMQIEAAYVKLVYNNEESTNFVKQGWTKKLEQLQEKMNTIDSDTKSAYTSQYETDINTLLATRHSLSNQDFVSVAHQFLSTKYDWRSWFVLVYGEVSGFRDHCVSTCRGTHRFRQNGRNIIVSSIDETERNNALSHRSRNWASMNSPNPNWWHNRDYSLGWVNAMRGHLSTCNDVDTVASVAWGSNVWYMNGPYLLYKKTCNPFNICYNTYLFG